jgi:hypothetical protein
MTLFTIFPQGLAHARKVVMTCCDEHFTETSGKTRVLKLAFFSFCILINLNKGQVTLLFMQTL